MLHLNVEQMHMQDFALNSAPVSQVSSLYNNSGILFDQSYGAVVPDISSSNINVGVSSNSRVRVRPRGGGANSNSSFHNQLSGMVPDAFSDTRNVMRLAYKQLKADGPHLFDFSKPFTAPVNQAVATRVADLARTLPQCKNWDEATWQSEITICLRLLLCIARNCWNVAEV